VDITLALYERRKPWYLALMCRQLRIELAMCGAIKGLSGGLAVCLALIRIKESIMFGLRVRSKS